MIRSAVTENDPHTKASLETATPASAPVLRIKSEDLLQRMREVEIEHDGRIYRLRVTQLNKLILTA